MKKHLRAWIMIPFYSLGEFRNRWKGPKTVAGFIMEIGSCYQHKCNHMKVDQDMERGARQGCRQAPDFSNLYREEAIISIKDLEGIKIGGSNVNNLRNIFYHLRDTIKSAKKLFQQSSCMKQKHGQYPRPYRRSWKPQKCCSFEGC